MLIGDSFFDLPMNIANEIIKDLQRKIDPSKQKYSIEYQGFGKEIHRASVFQHDANMDGPSDAWATQINIIRNLIEKIGLIFVSFYRWTINLQEQGLLSRDGAKEQWQ